jgi:hypothetical protein
MYLKKGTWVADLDLLHLIHGPLCYLKAERSHYTKENEDHSAIHGITTVDNRFEYSDRPPNTAVIRASKNWVARLALAAIPMTEKKALIMGLEKFAGLARRSHYHTSGF